jgi:hypothetical protein
METLQLHTSPKLSSLQLELLRIYSFSPSDSELIEIKRILAKFFADKLSMLVNKAIEIKGITENEIDNWLNDENQ